MESGICGNRRLVGYVEADDLKYEVVWSANEDVTGVHEVLWSANGWWPDRTAGERLRAAEEALEWALKRRLIDLYYEDTDDARPLARHEWGEALRARRSWAIPDGPCLFFWRTEAGESFIRDRPVPKSWVRRAWTGARDDAGDINFSDLS